jgi:hypothetical protein
LTLTHQNNLKIQKNINLKKNKILNFFKNTFETQKQTRPKTVIKPSL